MSESTPPPLISCESLLFERIGVVARVFPVLDSDGSEIVCPGNIWVTNYRLLFKAIQSESRFAEELSDFDFPIGWITKVEKVKPKGVSKFKSYTSITTYFGLTVVLRFPLNSGIKKELMACLTPLILSPSTLKAAFCFSNEEPPEAAAGFDGWTAFKPSKEYARMTLDVLELRGLTASSQAVFVNGAPQVSKWKLSVPYEADRAPHGVRHADWPDVYPTFGVVVPMTCDNNIHFAPAGKVRDEKQVPVIIWSHPHYTGIIGRGMISVGEESAIASASSSKYDYDPDITLLEMYGRKLGTKTILVEVGGARPVPANQLYIKTGKIETQFLALPSNSDLAKDWSDTMQNYLKKIEQAPWWRNSDTILRSVGELTSALVGGKGIFLLGSKRNLMHVPIASLLQIVLDPHYRTIQGFATLIQKDWIEFTFPFFTHVVKDKGSLPHFELFLTCLWTLLISFPSAFEYSDKMLVFLLDNIMSCRFGTFLAQTTKELEMLLIGRTPSIWTWIFTHVEDFRNPYYVAPPADALPIVTRLSLDEVLSSTNIWAQLFLRYEWDQLSDSVRSMTVMSPTSTTFMAPGALRNLSWLKPSLLSRITTLSLPDNKIFAPQWEMLSASNLEDVNLSNNPLYVLPSEYLKVLGRNCPHLRSLVLDRTRVGVYPSNIHKFIPSLRELRMKQVAAPPRSLIFLPAAPIDPPESDSFQVLDLSENNLSQLGSKLINVWSLTALDLSGNGFASIPIEISYLQRLKDLKLSGNKLSVFSSPKPNLFMLESLDVSNNGMVVISDDSPSMINLRTIDLSFNKLKILNPLIFTKMPHLEVLNLSQNLLTNIPATMSSLDKLVQLDISFNQLETFPDAITNAVSLQNINASNNLLQDLPVSICRLKQLKTLNVAHNKMKNFPPQLGLMASTIQSFIWEGNPLEIQQEVLAQGGRGVLEFLRDMMNGASPCFRMKLMIVGEENVGKTTLTEQLIKRWQNPWSQVDIDPNKNISTDGVDISSASFDWVNEGPKAIPKFKQGETIPVSVSLWDFGGQTVYYTTHQFFLSERSLFLVLYNLERPIEDSRVDYWLNSIQSKVRAASVIVVGTHLDGLKKEKRDELDSFMRSFKVQYRTAYPTIDLAFQAISARTGEGVPELKDLIEKRVMNSKNMGEMLPESYLLLERSILEERKLRNPPILSKAKFVEIGHLCNIKDERELFRASGLLHNLGTLIYFDKDPTLSQYVILNPHFLARVFSSLITTKHRYTMGGMIPHSALLQIWRDYPQEAYAFLLSLLEKFEVIYCLAGQNGKFVIPEASRRQVERPMTVISVSNPAPTLSAPSRHTIMDPPSSAPASRRLSMTNNRRHTVQQDADSASGTSKLSGIDKHFAAGLRVNNQSKAVSPERSRSASSSPSMNRSTFVSAKPSALRDPSLSQRGIVIGFNRSRSNSGAVERRSSFAPPSAKSQSAGNSPVLLPETNRVQSGRLSLLLPAAALAGDERDKAKKSGFDPNGYSLVPSALDPTVPEGVSEIWSEFPPIDQNEVNRSYRFSFLPQGFFSRLMVRLLQRFQGTSASDTTHYWSNGILMVRGQESIFATIIPDQLRLDVFVRGGPFDRISPIFCAIIEAMSLLIREWGSITVKQVVLCSHCRRSSMAEPTEFPIELLTASVRAKLDTADCVRTTGGLHPVSAEVTHSLFQAAIGSPGAAGAPAIPTPKAQSPTQPIAVEDAFQQQMDDFQAQLEALIGGSSPNAPSPGAVALPGMSSPNPVRPVPSLLGSSMGSSPLSSSSPAPEVEDMPVLNPVKRALLEDPNTICSEVRLDLLVPDLKLVYLKGNLVKWDDLSIEKQIGRGGFAIVYKGTYKGEVVAIKKLEVKEDDEEVGEDSSYAKAFAEFRKEAFIMTQITDPHCVVLKGVCLDPFALITEFVPNGDLYSIVNKPEKFPIDWNLRLKISIDMAKGMLFMHSQQPPIIHNDLKTPNVLMMSLDPNAPVCAKVSDFGLSMQVSKMYKRLVDNPVWTAPEIMMGQTYTEKADVYAYGVMLWELLERKQYFSHVPFNSDLEIRVMAGERSPLTQDCMPEYEKLLRMCWDQNPNKRPDFATVVKILELMAKKYAMGLAVVGPNSEVQARMAPPPGPGQVVPPVAASSLPAAEKPGLVKSWSQSQIPRSSVSKLKQPDAAGPADTGKSPSATAAMQRTNSTSTLQRNRSSNGIPTSPESVRRIAVAPERVESPSHTPTPAQPAATAEPTIAAVPSQVVTPTIPAMQAPPSGIDLLPTSFAPTSTAAPVASTPSPQVITAPTDTVGAPQNAGSSSNIRVAAIGGAGVSNSAIASMQEQLRSSVKRAPSISHAGQQPGNQQQPPSVTPVGAGAPPKGALKKMPPPGAAGKGPKQPPPGTMKKGPPAGSLKKAPAPSPTVPAQQTADQIVSEDQLAAQIADAVAPAPVAADASIAAAPEPAELTLPESAIEIETIRAECDGIEVSLKTGTLKSFAVLKILSGDEDRASDDQVEKTIIEVVQLVRSMRTASQTVMQIDTSASDPAQFQRQQDASSFAQAVIDSLLTFCKTAKAVDGAQRGLLTANDIGDVDVDSVREQSGKFAASVKAYLAVLRPIKEWFKSTGEPYFFPISS